MNRGAPPPLLPFPNLTHRYYAAVVEETTVSNAVEADEGVGGHTTIKLVKGGEENNKNNTTKIIEEGIGRETQHDPAPSPADESNKRSNNQPG